MTDQPKRPKKRPKRRSKPPPSRPRLTLVRLRKEFAADYAGILDSDASYVFMGVIRQMPGHCVVARMTDGKLYVGYHSSAFEIIPKEDV